MRLDPGKVSPPRSDGRWIRFRVCRSKTSSRTTYDTFPRRRHTHSLIHTRVNSHRLGRCTFEVRVREYSVKENTFPSSKNIRCPTTTTTTNTDAHTVLLSFPSPSGRTSPLIGGRRLGGHMDANESVGVSHYFLLIKTS